MDRLGEPLDLPIIEIADEAAIVEEKLHVGQMSSQIAHHSRFVFEINAVALEHRACVFCMCNIYT
jgi:hypothetical protein